MKENEGALICKRLTRRQKWDGRGKNPYVLGIAKYASSMLKPIEQTPSNQYCHALLKEAKVPRTQHRTEDNGEEGEP